MSNGIPSRKRDRFLRPFWKANQEPASASVAPRPSNLAQPVATSPQTTNASLGFLQNALEELGDEERVVIEQCITSGIDDTIQAAYEASKRQKLACEEKRWPGSDGADKVLVWLDRFKSVGDVVANVDPVHVGLPWAGIRLLLETVIADSRQMSALVTGMDLALCMANRLRAYIVYYQRLPPALTPENLRKALVALYAHVLRFLARAIQVYSTNTALRKVQAFWQDSDLMTFESQSDKLAERVDIEANNSDRELRVTRWAAATQWKDELDVKLQQLATIGSIQSSFDALQAKVDLSKLFRVQEATYNSTVEEKLSRCLDGTRSQILQNIMQWAQEPDGKLMFWLCGQAGTGKSTLSRTVAYNFDRQDCLGASFFFKKGEDNRSSADHFFSTITAQLADMIPCLQAPVAAALDKDSFLCGRGIQEQFEKLLLQPLLSVNPAQLPRKRVAIVIDALDECDRDTDIRMFLRLLAQVKSKSALSLRIFVTSRPELPIRLGFRQLDKNLHQDVVLEEIQEHTISADIRTYFDSELAKIKEDQLLAGTVDQLPTDWPSEHDTQVLVSLAVPLFIFATTVCRFISESRPQKRLRLVIERQHSAGSSHMAKLYLPILDQLLVAKEEDEQQEILHEFREVVGPIVLAADPLSVASLARLLSLDGVDIQLRLEQLHSVLQVSSNVHNPVRLLHLSFRDFLVDPTRKDKSGFWIDEADTHGTLARGCLRRLSEDGVLRMDVCGVVRPAARRTELTIQRIETHIPPDVAYACSYWPVHFLKSKAPLCGNGVVHCFLQTHFLHWLEALSWLGRLSSAVIYVSDLISIAQSDGCSEVARFLEDGRRFILYNRHGIDLAPLQIYHSAMVFTPRQSIVRDTFYAQAPQLWKLVPDAPLRWSAEILTLVGHNDKVTAIAFSPDSQVVASASLDSTVRLWSAATGEQTQKLEGHKGGVNAVAFSPDGQVIVSASIDWTVRLWNVATGEQMQMLEGHENWVNVVAFSPNGQVVVSASHDYVVRLWNIATGEQTHMLKANNGLVSAVAFSPDGQVAVMALATGTIQLWNIATGEQTQELEGHDRSVHAVAFSLDGHVIASGSADHTVRLWNIETGEEAQQLARQDIWAHIVAFSPDGQVITVGIIDDTVRLWDVATGQETQKLEGLNLLINAVAISPDGQAIALASADMTVRLWSIAAGQETEKPEKHNIWVNAVSVSHDEQMVATASHDRAVRVWSAQTGRVIQLFQDVGIVNEITFSVDGKSLVTNVGNFSLETPISDSPIDIAAQTASLDVDGPWVRHRGVELLWLPHEYREECSAARGQTLVIGHSMGATIFRLAQDTVSSDPLPA